MGRSRAVKPTRDQKALISAAGLEVRSWSLLGDLKICPRCGGRMELVHNDAQR